MEQLIDGLKPFLAALGVEPAMYGVIAAFGIAHQFACGYFARWTREWSFASASVFAFGLGLGTWIEVHLTPTQGMTRILALLAAALIAEALANKAADFLPFVPKYNEKVANPPKEEKP